MIKSVAQDKSLEVILVSFFLQAHHPVPQSVIPSTLILTAVMPPLLSIGTATTTPLLSFHASLVSSLYHCKTLKIAFVSIFVLSCRACCRMTFCNVNLILLCPYLKVPNGFLTYFEQCLITLHGIAIPTLSDFDNARNLISLVCFFTSIQKIVLFHVFMTPFLLNSLASWLAYHHLGQYSVSFW